MINLLHHVDQFTTVMGQVEHFYSSTETWYMYNATNFQGHINFNRLDISMNYCFNESL